MVSYLSLLLCFCIFLVHAVNSRTNSSSSAAANVMCKNPTTHQLSELMIKFEKTLDGALSLLDVDSIRDKLSGFIIADSLNSSAAMGKCILDGLQQQQEQQHGQCSWHNKLVYRFNRFPHLITHAVCNCGSCEHINREIKDFEFSCQSLRKLNPTLVRGRCRNGVYEWKPALEYISIACLCMRNGTNLPVN